MSVNLVNYFNPNSIGKDFIQRHSFPYFHVVRTLKFLFLNSFFYFSLHTYSFYRMTCQQTENKNGFTGTRMEINFLL